MKIDDVNAAIINVAEAYADYAVAEATENQNAMCWESGRRHKAREGLQEALDSLLEANNEA